MRSRGIRDVTHDSIIEQRLSAITLSITHTPVNSLIAIKCEISYVRRTFQPQNSIVISVYQIWARIY